MAINPELENVTLARGAHGNDFHGAACAMELVSLLAHEPFSDHPSCTSPVLAAFVRRWNDALPDEPRQELKKFLPRLVGTAGDREADKKRAYMATDWSVRVAAPTWLRLAKLETEAKLLESVGEIVDGASARAADSALRVARDAAYKAKSAAYRQLQEKYKAAGKTPAAAAAAYAADAADADAAYAAAASAYAYAAYAADAAAYAYARSALEPTVLKLRASVFDLLDRMIEVRTPAQVA